MNTKEQITLANTDTSQEQNFNQPSCLADTKSAAVEHTYINLDFDNSNAVNTTLFNNNIVHYCFNTKNPNAHKNNQDGSYYFIFSSSDTELTGRLYEEGKRILGPYHDNSIEFAVLLSYNKNYEFVVEPDDKFNNISISAHISYSNNNEPETIPISTNTESITIKIGEKKFLKYSAHNDKDGNIPMWESSNSSIVNVSITGRMTALKPGRATITVSNPCGYLHHFEVRAVIDSVNIMYDGVGYNKVIFESSGKVWHCVYHDTVFETNVAAVIGKLNNLNYYVNFDEKENMPLSEDIKIFSKEELRLLYGIDPLGVANYIKRRTERLSIPEAINKKDEFFELFFGRKPYCFKRDFRGEWIPVNKSEQEDLSIVLSESELIMGQHMIWDRFVWENLFVSLIKLIIDTILIAVPHIKVLKKLFEKHPSLQAMATIYSYSTCDSFDDILATTSSSLLELMYENTSIDLIYQLVDIFATLGSFFESIDISNTFYLQKFEYCIDDNKYEIYVNSTAGNKYKLNDYKKYIAK